MNMKRMLAAVLALSVMLVTCSCSGVKQEEYDALNNEYNAVVADYEALKAKYEPYAGIIDALEEHDYDSASKTMSKMKSDWVIQTAGDITDHLMVVDLTAENLLEYFSIESIAKYNAFGDPDGYRAFLKSRLYDEGWVVYKGQNDIILEYIGISSWATYNPADYDTDIRTGSLGGFLSGGRYTFYEGQCLPEFTGRISGGSLTFVNMDYVASVETEEAATPDNSNRVTITLLNGEKLVHNVYENYYW